MGNADKLIRLCLAVIFFALWFQNIITGTLGIILLVLAGIFVLNKHFRFLPAMQIAKYQQRLEKEI